MPDCAPPLGGCAGLGLGQFEPPPAAGPPATEFGGVASWLDDCLTQCCVLGVALARLALFVASADVVA
eukprot:6611292-Lingulodinium_polyedra.AAC.1